MSSFQITPDAKKLFINSGYRSSIKAKYKRVLTHLILTLIALKLEPKANEYKRKDLEPKLKP